MIVTVTMNPAIDKTVEIETLERGSLNRIRSVTLDAGGKGINVSKTVKELGGRSVAAGFLAGNSGRTIEKVLRDSGIETDFLYVDGETRTNMKVIEQDGTVTELNEPGPVVTKEQVEDLTGKLEGYASPETLFVLSGSVPQGVEKDIYGVITKKVHEKGAAVLLDADGELFARAIEAVPDMVKPNQEELERYAETCGKKFAGNLGQPEHIEALIQTGEYLLEQGIGLAAISMGAQGAVFLNRNVGYRSDALPVEVRSTVGAGDAMAAALAFGWEQKMDLEKSAALGMAVSAGAVTTQGTKPPSRELVENLLGQVKMIKI